MNPAAATGKVFAEILVKIREKRNSFQEKMKHIIADAARPGAVRGNITLRKAPNLVQPSTIAASSKAVGISSKNPRIIQMTNEKLNVIYAITKTSFVSRRPTELNIKKRGKMTEIGGAIRAVKK